MAQATLPQNLILADTCWHSTRNLVHTWPPRSNESARILQIEPIDWHNAVNRRIPPWRWGVRTEKLSESASRLTAELPPGWMKSWPCLGQWPLSVSIRKWLRQQSTESRPYLWITYPFYTELARQLGLTPTIYYNLDDYTHYWPSQSQTVIKAEAQTVISSQWTVCVSRYRAEELKKKYPSAVKKIFHLPHAAPEWTIPEKPSLDPSEPPEFMKQIPRPILGYLGGLEDRLDWELLERIAQQFSDCSLVLVGPKPPADSFSETGVKRNGLLQLPNVYAVGSVKQSEIAGVYACFDVNLIPYRTDNLFNRACSPTKLLDAMGSGRPTVTTDLPECVLYQSLYTVADSHTAFCRRIEELKSRNFSDGREIVRWNYARSRRSELVLDALFRLSECTDPELARAIIEPLSAGVSDKPSATFSSQNHQS